jgi:hypothetical protein
MISEDNQVRTKLNALALSLRHFHSALLDFAKTEYELLHGKIKGPFALYSLVVNDSAFQWLRPLSALMATLDEVLDAKDTVLTGQNVTDLQQALGLLFSGTDTRFIAFQEGYRRAKDESRVLETEAKWREILNALEA